MKPVGFTMQAIVTTSDLELSPSELDFGYCTIYEAIKAEITLYNHSLLPQEFGFVGLPKVPLSLGPDATPQHQRLLPGHPAAPQPSPPCPCRPPWSSSPRLSPSSHGVDPWVSRPSPLPAF